MKVLQIGQMPDGTEIQVEDWSENYSFYAYGSFLVAYPKNRYGEEVRASKIFENAEEAENAFNALKNGDKALTVFNFTVKESGRDIPYSKKNVSDVRESAESIRGQKYESI